MHRSPLIRAFLAAAACSVAIALSGCNTDGVLPMSEKAAQPLSEKMVAEIEAKNMDKDAPILVRLFKQEAELEVWKQDRTGHFALLKTYPICRWSGDLGPKKKEGDRQAPEGFYSITPGQMNPNSAYYLSFDLGYPNAYDRSWGRTGSQLMVHGDCSSRGCYSMTDEQIAEIYALGRDAFFGGQKAFQVQAYPFRMTAANLAKHRDNPNMPFWKMLKVGSDHFEVTHLQPAVNVCEKRYVFDAEPPAGSTRPLTFSASGKCPAFQVPEEIASAVREKERKDDIQVADLVRRGTPTVPVHSNVDGGMNEVFVAAVKRNQIGVHPQDSILVSTPPGTIPPTVRPPRIPELADAPIMTGEAPPPRSPEISLPQLAIAEPAAAPASAKKSGGLFGSLFSSSDDKPAEAAEAKSASPIDRMAHFIGLQKGDGKAKTAKTNTPTPKPRPAVQHPTRMASHGAIRTKEEARAEPASRAESAKRAEPPKRSESAKRAEPAPPAQTAVAWPAPPPPRTPAVPAHSQAAASTAMNGAAPVVPSGTFDSRWSAFR